MDSATPAHTEPRGEECVCLKEMRGLVKPSKGLLYKEKKLVLYSLYLSVSLSIFLSVEGSRSVQQPAAQSKLEWTADSGCRKPGSMHSLN